MPPTRKTKRASKKKKPIKKHSKRHVAKRKSESKGAPRMEYILNLQMPLQHRQSQEEIDKKQELEHAGFYPQRLLREVQREILRRFSDFQNHRYREVYESIFAMITVLI